jgi:urease accessory protein
MIQLRDLPGPGDDPLRRTHRSSDAGNPSDTDLQRAQGFGRIIFGAAEKGARIIDVFEKSPVRVLFPRADSGAIEEAVLLNTSGGIAGGDQLQYEVTALPKASMAVTTQAAEKVYRALNEPARITTRLKVCDAATLAWLPQETIAFNCARVNRTTELDLSSGAELLALESLVLGRAAHGEHVTGGHITESWRVTKDGRLIWADTLRITDGMCADLYRTALLADCKTVATLIYFGPHLEKRLEFLRDVTSSLQCHCATTSVGGLIIVRFAAKVSDDLRRALCGCLQQLSRELGPEPFRVPKMWSL